MASKYNPVLKNRYSTMGQPEGVGAGSIGQPANTAPPPPAAPGAAPPPQYSPNGYQPITNTHSITEANRQNRLNSANVGNELQGQAGQTFNYYGGQEAGYGQQAAGAYGQLQQQPGYTPGQAGQINTNYSQFNTPEARLNQQYLTGQEQAGIQGNPNAAYNGAFQNAQKNISGSFADTYGKQMAGVGQLQGGVNRAATTEQGGLNTAANRADLGVSNQDVQDIKTAAGRRVGDQYQGMEDQLQRSAAASGNASPYAMGAMLNRYGKSAAEASGEAAGNAEIAARQYKLGAAQTQAGMQMGAAATGGQAAMTAADIGGQAAINTAYNTGNQALNEEQNMAALGSGLQQTAEQQAAARAAQLAGNRQATTQGIQATQYGQGTNSAQLTAGGATNVGQTQIAGQNQYRNYLTGEQQLAQQGQMGALGAQVGAYGAQNQGINQAQANANNYENGQHNAGVGELGTILNAVWQDGGIVNQPTAGIAGERGPEWIGPPTNLPQFSQIPYQNPIAQQMASQQPDITTKPPDNTPSPSTARRQPNIGGVIGGAIRGYMGGGGWTGAAKGAFGATPAGQIYNQYRPPNTNPAAQPLPPGGEQIGTMTSIDGSPQGSQYQPLGTMTDMYGNPRRRDQEQRIGTMDRSMATSDGSGMMDSYGGGDQMAAGGTIVTHPTRVILAEHGQPEAVVPLTPRSTNRLQPSMLGGLNAQYGIRPKQFAPSPYNPNSRQVGPLRSMIGTRDQRITGW